jgi:hypothetical protein
MNQVPVAEVSNKITRQESKSDHRLLLTSSERTMKKSIGARSRKLQNVRLRLIHILV